jgi:hypothetical protein
MVAFDALDGRTQLLIVTMVGLVVTALAAVVGMVLVWLVQRLVLKVRGRE